LGQSHSTCLSRSTFSMISSNFSMIDRPERGLSLTSKFPVRKQANHFRAANLKYLHHKQHKFFHKPVQRSYLYSYLVMMLQNIANFFLIYLHFQNKRTLDSLHRFQSFFGSKKQRLKCQFSNVRLMLLMRLVGTEC